MSEAKRESKGPVRGYFFDKSVVVTGASSGIGPEVALGFDAPGRAGGVAGAAQSIPVEDLAGRIEAAGGRAIAIGCDVTKRSDVDTRQSGRRRRRCGASTSW